MDTQLSLSILLIGFNRPDLFISNFEELYTTTDSDIYISLDGPRTNNKNDEKQCARLRSYVEMIASDPRVSVNISNTNLGCKAGVEAALDWFFQTVEFGLILEDDCFISTAALEYALLGKQTLQDHTNIFALNLVNFSDGLSHKENHTLTKYLHVWGWVTSSQNWQQYRMSPIQLDRKALTKWSFDYSEFNYWLKNYNAVQSGRIDTWDYNLQCHLINNNLFCVAPMVCLAENRGFNEEATHTKIKPKYLPKVSVSRQMKGQFNLDLQYNASLDQLVYTTRLKRPRIISRALAKIRTLLTNEL